MPFACVAVADGALRLPEIAGRVTARLAGRVTARRAAGTVLAALALTTAAHLGWLVHRARSREVELRGYEANVARE